MDGFEKKSGLKGVIMRTQSLVKIQRVKSCRCLRCGALMIGLTIQKGRNQKFASYLESLKCWRIFFMKMPNLLLPIYTRSCVLRAQKTDQSILSGNI